MDEIMRDTYRQIKIDGKLLKKQVKKFRNNQQEAEARLILILGSMLVVSLFVILIFVK
jgi:uncharacterized membrane protein